MRFWLAVLWGERGVWSVEWAQRSLEVWIASKMRVRSFGSSYSRELVMLSYILCALLDARKAGT